MYSKGLGRDHRQKRQRPRPQPAVTTGTATITTQQDQAPNIKSVACYRPRLVE